MRILFAFQILILATETRLDSCLVNIYSATRWQEQEFLRLCQGFQFVLNSGLVEINKITILTTKGNNFTYRNGLNIIRIHFYENNSCKADHPKYFTLEPLHYDDDYSDTVNALTSYLNSLREGDVIVGVTFGGSRMLGRDRNKILLPYGINSKLLEDDRDFIFASIKGFPGRSYFKTTQGRCQVVFAQLRINGGSGKHIKEVWAGIGQIQDKPW